MTIKPTPRTGEQDAVEIEPLTDGEVEAAFVALMEMFDGLGCCPGASVGSKDGQGVTFSLHFNADRVRKLVEALARQAPEPTHDELVAENERLGKAVCLGILGDLLTPDENDALVAFVKDLRSRQAPQQVSGDAPVAWRWCYEGDGRPRHWLHRGRPIEALDASPSYCARIVEPLYTHPLASSPPSTDGVIGECLSVLGMAAGLIRVGGVTHKQMTQARQRIDALAAKLQRPVR